MMTTREIRYVPEVDKYQLITASLEFHEARFLGVTIHAMTMEEMHDAIAFGIHTRQKWLIANHNLHSVYLVHKEMQERVSSTLRNFYKRAKWTHIDGMSMVLLARLRGHGVGRRHRVAYNYSLRPLMEMAQAESWRVFYLGSSEEVARVAADVLKTEFPSLVFENRNGFFDKKKDSAQNKAVLAQIAAFAPHILFVGMGMPSQEYWIEENFDDLSANVILHAGASLDYVANALPTPPAWIGRIGMEWMYRLANEPARLGFRYLAEPWLIMVNLVRMRLARTI